MAVTALPTLQAPRRPQPGAWRRHAAARGFTLVEMLVAMAVGMIVALALLVSVMGTAQQFRRVGTAANADVNAQIALSLVESAGRAAGAGLFSDAKMLCAGLNARRSNGNVASNGAALLPARITDGGSATTSDTLVFTGLTGPGAMSGAPVVVNMTSGTGSIVVNDAAEMANGELALVGVPGSGTTPCTLFAVTAAPVSGTACGGNATQCRTLQRATSSLYNGAASTYTTEPLYGFTPGGGVVGPAVVHRVGTQFVQEAFAVQCQALVQYNAFEVTPSCTQSPLAFGAGVNALATDVVLMHAQYGVTAAANSDVVANWVNASGSWAAPATADIGRIKAIRVVVVVRSKEPDGNDVTAASCTNAAGVTNVGPCSFSDAEAPVIDLSAVPVPAGRNWRQYRYRVHQAVIPLRNVIWSL
jgi:type IV pilus assembly protein PilW